MSKKQQKLQITLHQRNSNSCEIEMCPCFFFFLPSKLPKVRKINANFTVAVGILKHYGWKIKLKSCLTAWDKGIKTPTSLYLVFPFMGLYPRVVKM